MTRCSVPKCSTAGGHLFPKDPKLRKQWLAFAKKRDSEIGPYAVICKMHFKEDDFLQLVPVPGLPMPRKRLKPKAVPSIVTEKAKPLPRVKFNPNNSRQSSPYASFKYDTLVDPVHKSKSKLSCKNRFLGGSVAVLTDKELVVLIEGIKDKLMKNAPSSAQFPPRWKQPGPIVKPNRIREGYPPFSMACLIAMAVESAPWFQASMPQILAFISKNFPCYKMHQKGWQENVIRTIDRYKMFKKVRSKEVQNPKQTYWTFGPDRKTVISPEVYEALTDPRYDESNIDFSHAIIQTDFEIVSVCSESLESRVVDMDEELDLPEAKDGNNPINGNDNGLREASTRSDSEENDAQKDCDETEGSGNECGDIDMYWSLLEESSLSENDILSDEEEEEEEGEEDEEEKEVANILDEESDETEPAEVLFKCSFCNFSSKSNEVTSNHLLQKHLKGNMFFCKNCDYVTANNSLLEAHKAKGQCKPTKPHSSKE